MALLPEWKHAGSHYGHRRCLGRGKLPRYQPLRLRKPLSSAARLREVDGNCGEDPLAGNRRNLFRFHHVPGKRVHLGLQRRSSTLPCPLRVSCGNDCVRSVRGQTRHQERSQLHRHPCRRYGNLRSRIYHYACVHLFAPPRKQLLGESDKIRVNQYQLARGNNTYLFRNELVGRFALAGDLIQKTHSSRCTAGMNASLCLRPRMDG